MVGLSYEIYPNNSTCRSCFDFHVVWHRSTLPISFKVVLLAVGSHAPLSMEQRWRVRVDKSREPHNDSNYRKPDCLFSNFSGQQQRNYRSIASLCSCQENPQRAGNVEGVVTSSCVVEWYLELQMQKTHWAPMCKCRLNFKHISIWDPFY